MGLCEIGQKFINRLSAHPLFTDPKVGRQSVDEIVMFAVVSAKSCYFTQFNELTDKKLNKMNAFFPSKLFQNCDTFSPQNWKVHWDFKKKKAAENNIIFFMNDNDGLKDAF